MYSNTPERILIVKLSAIGDVLMATPVARALREAFPDSFIAWVVERKSADVVIGNPYLDEVIVWDRVKRGSMIWATPRGSFGAFRGFAGSCGRGTSMSCVDLQGLLRSAGVCLASGARRRIGFADGAEGSVRIYTERYDPGGDEVNAQQRNLDLLKTLGVNSTDTTMHMPVSDDDRDFAARFFAENDLDGSKVVAFCPATTWVNKHWTPDGWCGVADLIGREVRSEIAHSRFQGRCRACRAGSPTRPSSSPLSARDTRPSSRRAR